MDFIYSSLVPAAFEICIDKYFYIIEGCIKVDQVSPKGYYVRIIMPAGHLSHLFIHCVYRPCSCYFVCNDIHSYPAPAYKYPKVSLSLPYFLRHLYCIIGIIYTFLTVGTEVLYFYSFGLEHFFNCLFILNSPVVCAYCYFHGLMICFLEIIVRSEKP